MNRNLGKDSEMDFEDGKDREFAQALREALRASENLDATTAARLRAARIRAVTVAGTRSAPRWAWAVPAALAASVLAALLLPSGHHSATMQPETLAAVPAPEALDLLADEMDPQFYRDLRFYQWLAQQDHHA
ncbi:MAG: hypothetical protein ACRETW_03345 [Stenotrophobium sp.]